MKRQLWLMGVDLAGKNRVQWYIEYTDKGWTLSCDAVSRSDLWLAPFETSRGRFELAALFFTKEQYEQAEIFLQELYKKFDFADSRPKTLSAGNPELTDMQRKVLLLYEMGHTEEEIADAASITPYGVKQISYRLRLSYGFSKTMELIKFLRANGRL
jgi:DNA-binding CsgD family transcriptional regulator